MLGDYTYIKTVGDLRKALKGIPGNKEIRVRIPFNQQGFFNPVLEKITYNEKYKEYSLVTSEIIH